MSQATPVLLAAYGNATILLNLQIAGKGILSAQTAAGAVTNIPL